MHNYDTEERRKALAAALEPLKRFVIPPEKLKYRLGPPLGRGGFGSVKLATITSEDSTPAQVAVKTLYRRSEESARVALRFARELTIWSQLEHPNILDFTGYYQDARQLYLVSPYLKNGNVKTYMIRNQVDIHTRMHWVVGVTNGLKYLHTSENHIVHGDLKAENILLDCNLDPVICDFGLSAVVSNGVETGLTTSEGLKGTLACCSPELLQNGARTMASDMWAWALVVLQLCTGVPPYKEERDLTLVDRIIHGRPPTDDEYPPFPLSEYVWPCVLACLDRDPTKRPSILDCSSYLTAAVVMRMRICTMSPDIAVTGANVVFKWKLLTDSAAEMCISPRGKLLAVACCQRDQTIVQLWDLQDGLLLWTCPVGRRTSKDLPPTQPQSLQLRFNSDETLLMARITDDTLFIGDIRESSGSMHIIDRSCKGVTFVGRRVWVWTEKKVELWNEPTSSSLHGDVLLHTEDDPRSTSLRLVDVVPSPDGHRALVAFHPRDNDGLQIAIWDVPSASEPSGSTGTTGLELCRVGTSGGYNWLSNTHILVTEHSSCRVFDVGEHNGAKALDGRTKERPAPPDWVHAGGTNDWTHFYSGRDHQLYASHHLLASLVQGGNRNGPFVIHIREADHVAYSTKQIAILKGNALFVGTTHQINDDDHTAAQRRPAAV